MKSLLLRPPVAILTGMGIACIGMIALGSQTPPLVEDPPQNGVIWEYLLMSPGKVFFESAMDNPSIDVSLSKIAPYSVLGVTALEGILAEQQLDAIGKLGWELVAIVGDIGGDQEFVFKRQFDAARSANELERIEAEAAAMRQALDAMKKREAEVASPLVDLDQVDWNARHEVFIQKMRAAVQGCGYSVSDLEFGRPSYSNPERVHVHFALDGTSNLLSDGNKYRKSMANDFARQAITSIVRAGGLVESEIGGDVEMDARVEIAVNGTRTTVCEYSSRAKWKK